MEFSYRNNGENSDQYFDNWIAEMEDPPPIRLVNAVPYIPMLEYGGVRVYHRQQVQRLFLSGDGGKARKIGVFRFPKGGVVTRSRMETTVFQPPKMMVRRTRLTLGTYVKSLCRQQMPRKRSQLRGMSISMGKYALIRVKSYTPVDEDIARQGWRMET